jgi:hypothetical protein
MVYFNNDVHYEIKCYCTDEVFKVGRKPVQVKIHYLCPIGDTIFKNKTITHVQL